MRGVLHRAGVAWCALALTLLLGSLLASQVPNTSLEWQPSEWAAQPWRCWTAAFVHYSRMHLLGNLTGLALTAAFGWVSLVPPRVAAAWLAAWPLTHLGLGLMPSLLHYGGLSGVVHAGVAVVITHTLLNGTRDQRWVVTGLLAGLLTKIATETPWGAAVQHYEGWDIGIAPFVHVTGVVAGTLCMLAVELGSRARRTA